MKPDIGNKIAADVDVFLSKEEVNSKPVRRYTGKILLVDSRDKVPGAVERLASEEVLGFDTETRPAFRKGEQHSTALLQLAGSDLVVVFRLNMIGLLPELKEILSSKKIIKAGIAPRRDVEELKDLSPFRDGGFVDLAQMAKERGLKNGGLKSLAANLLGYRVSKGMRTSNWENRNLSDKQLAYAATDAWVSRELYFALGKLKVVEEDELPAVRKKSGKCKVEKKKKESSEASKACRGD